MKTQQHSNTAAVTALTQTVNADQIRAIAALNQIAVPLPMLSMLTARATTDSFGAFIADAVYTAVAQQYKRAVYVDGFGSFGGSTAFKRLPHRALAENARRFSLSYNSAATVCAVCGTAAADICHKIPRSASGNLTTDNLFIGCAACNRLQRDSMRLDMITALYQYTVVIDVSARAMKRYTE